MLSRVQFQDMLAELALPNATGGGAPVPNNEDEAIATPSGRGTARAGSWPCRPHDARSHDPWRSDTR
jgi:hypothetical protein